jgi:hypothetical protein
MNLNQALDVSLRTHMAAIQAGVRPNAEEWVSGPGVGKSTTVREMMRRMAVELGRPVGLVTEMLATIQSVDVRGFMLPQKAADGTIRPITVFSIPPWFPTRQNTTVFMPDGSEVLPPHAADVAVPDVGVVFLDEWGQGENEVKAAAAELLLNGQVGGDRLPVGWRVIAASNRMTDRAGVVRSLTFITNRRREVNIDANVATWMEWANNLDPAVRPHHYTLSFASKQPDLVFRDTVPPGDKPFCTPRTLVLMDRDLRSLRTPDDLRRDRLPTDQVAREVVSGWIGGPEGAQFMTHLRFADLLPDIADIERDPMRAKLPDDRAAQMVCAFMLAHHLNKDRAVNLLRYVRRLNIEMQVLAMRTITARTEHAKLVALTPSYQDWLLENKDILIASHQ